MGNTGPECVTDERENRGAAEERGKENVCFGEGADRQMSLLTELLHQGQWQDHADGHDDHQVVSIQVPLTEGGGGERDGRKEEEKDRWKK